MLQRKIKQVMAGLLVLTLCSFTGIASAGGYVGAGAGITTVDVCDDINGAFPGLSCDDEDTGFKIFGGYKANEHFAIEALWADLGEVSVSGPGGSLSLSVDGFGAAAVGILPLNEKFGLFGKIGMFMWDISGGGLASGASDDGTDIMFGAGVNWNLTQKFGLRAEWERFDVDGDDVDFLSIGAQFNF
jgi:OOP family OmpA-OmpF porin